MSFSDMLGEHTLDTDAPGERGLRDHRRRRRGRLREQGPPVQLGPAVPQVPYVYGGYSLGRDRPRWAGSQVYVEQLSCTSVRSTATVGARRVLPVQPVAAARAPAAATAHRVRAAAWRPGRSPCAPASSSSTSIGRPAGAPEPSTLSRHGWPWCTTTPSSGPPARSWASASASMSRPRSDSSTTPAPWPTSAST